MTRCFPKSGGFIKVSERDFAFLMFAQLSPISLLWRLPCLLGEGIALFPILQ